MGKNTPSGCCSTGTTAPSTTTASGKEHRRLRREVATGADERAIHRKAWFSVDRSKASLLRSTGNSPADQPIPGQPGWGQAWLCNGQPIPVDLANPPTGENCTGGDDKLKDDLPTDVGGMLTWLYENSDGGTPPGRPGVHDRR